MTEIIHIYVIAFFSYSTMTPCISSRIFSLDNGEPLRLWNLFWYQTIPYSIYLFGFPCTLVCVSFVKIVQEILSKFKYADIDFFLENFIIHNHKFLMLFLIFFIYFFFLFLWTQYDSLWLVEFPLAIMLFDLSSSVEQNCDKVSSTRKSSDLLSSVEQICKIGICGVTFISSL